MSEQVLEFPQGPTDGQTITWSFEHTGGSAENNIMTRVWSWNDFRSAWISNKSKSSGLGIRDELAGGPSGPELFVQKSGDTMHGMLTVPILQATGNAGIVRGKLGEFSSGNITALTGNTAFFNQGRFTDSLTVDSSGGLSAALGNFSASLTASSFFSSTANITTANITTAEITTANITTAEITTATISNNLSGSNANFTGSLTAENIRSNALLSGTIANFTGSLTAGNIHSNSLLSGSTANFTGSLIADKAFRSSDLSFGPNEFVTLQHVLSLIPGPIITDYDYVPSSRRGKFKLRVTPTITLGIEFGKEMYNTFSWGGGNGYRILDFEWTYDNNTPYIISASAEIPYNPISDGNWAGCNADKAAQTARIPSQPTRFVVLIQGMNCSNILWNGFTNFGISWFILGKLQ
jgi:hypothetical protein